MSVKSFENQRWQSDQVAVFRHQAALEFLIKEPAASLLDVGCGDGFFLELLNKHSGLKGNGLDLSDLAVAKCQAKGFDCRLFDFDNAVLPFSDGSFETVVALDVLEHLYQPQELLKEMKRLARKNLILSVPNFNSLPARLQVLFGRVPQNNLPKKGHLYWFNLAVLSKLLADSGLKIQAVKSHTFWEKRPLIGGLMKFLNSLMPALFSLSFVVKAQKNNHNNVKK